MKTETTSVETKDIQAILDSRGYEIWASNATPMVRDEWQCLHYTVKLTKNGKPVWSGDYHIGLGHVKNLPRPEVAHSLLGGIPGVLPADVAAYLRNQSVRFIDPITAPTIAAYYANQKGKTYARPKLSDVLYSILSEGDAFFNGYEFEDWAANYGYDSDSRKAKQIWKACDKTGRKLISSLGDVEVKSLQGLFQNY